MRRTAAALPGRPALVGAWLGFCLLAWGLAGRGLDRPGLYYDEVVQAGPAVTFLAGSGAPLQIPGARSTRLLGRWFPVMTQPYMGALKSQALIPPFALFGASAESLRLTTLAFGALGLLLFLLFARGLLGLPTALLAGCLVATDPSFLFVSRHDWGSFVLGFVCRGGGLLALASGFGGARPGRLFLGGLLFGLGLYNKIDSAVFAAAAGVSLAVVSHRFVSDAVRARPGRLLLPVLGLGLGAAPMIAAAGGVLGATRSVFRSRGLGPSDLGEKLCTLVSTLDGSYFERLIRAGGSFESMFDGGVLPAGPFFFALLAGALGLGLALVRDARAGAFDRAEAWVLSTSLLGVLGILLTPRAVRIHHAMGVYPLPQLVVAIALVRLWRTRADFARLAAILGGITVVAGGLLAAIHTASLLRETGGKGRWSDSLTGFARELQARPSAVVVSLDWGFDRPLRFVAPDLRLVEPIWRLRRRPSPPRPWIFDGTPDHVYLLYPEELAVFDFGKAFLAAVRALPPGSAEVRLHRDRAGDVAFVSVRFARPHRLVYRGAFEVRLR